MNASLEISAHRSTAFLNTNYRKLLPDWLAMPQGIILILQQSRLPLSVFHPAVALEKERLREQFISLAQSIKFSYGIQGISTIAIDPQNGHPLDQRGGTLHFDMVEVVQQLLQYPYQMTSEGCKVLIHPRWQTAVYPGLLISQQYLF